MAQTISFDVVQGLLQRTVPDFAHLFRLRYIPAEQGKNVFAVETDGTAVILSGDTPVSAAMALGYYLKEICRVNWSWNGNRQVELHEMTLDFPSVRRVVPQEYRVYMNYCTLSYSMCWWDWKRWEKELDFMAVNGMNMPLCVIGTEAVWLETLLELGFREEEALACISSPAFWPWQLMTNLDSYQPIHTRRSVAARLELGKQILDRALEYGMTPIQQGFSGHVPVKLMEKFPAARIQKKPSWCKFPQTAQLDPLDPLFRRFGRIFLEQQEKLMGNYHFYACDPFHEGRPPKKGIFYLRKVGRAIDRLYQEYDPGSTWVMQSWSIRRNIAKAVPKEQLLILDLDGSRCKNTRYFWGYRYVSCHLHNFGGKNSLHGKLQDAAENRYFQQQEKGANVVGTGIMMEGIEQNPVYYDLLFDVDVTGRPIDMNRWLHAYTVRRYGQQDSNAQEAWRLLLQSCYNGAEAYEEEAGSVVCARPSLFPKHAAPNDKIGMRYDNRVLVSAIRDLLKSRSLLAGSDGYQFDLCDFTRQALSNLVVLNQQKIKEAYEQKDLEALSCWSKKQMEIMKDMDRLLSHRSELCLDSWLFDAQSLAKTEEEKRAYQKSAKLLLTIWGDAEGDPSLYDYAWREWSGLIERFYLPRWKKFYEALTDAMKHGNQWKEGKPAFFDRPTVFDTDFGKTLYQWEQEWVNTYEEIERRPTDTDVVPCVEEYMDKWFAANQMEENG